LLKKERVRAALAGEAVDRPPAGFWGHDFGREWSPDTLAEAMLEGFFRLDWDFLKVNPRATYYAEAWGCTYEPSGRPGEGPVTKSHVLHSASDLSKLGRVDVESGPFGEQLDALDLIGKGIDGDYIQTVFSPLSVIGRLADSNLEAVRRWMDDEPALLRSALEAVTETLAGYSRASLRHGASGIFFATTDWGTTNILTSDLYREFARPYDLAVLDAVRGAELNVLHVCKTNNLLADLLDYPVHAFNWADREEGNASLAEIAAKTDRAVMGGVSRATLADAGPADAAAQVHDAMETGGRRLLIAPDCSVSPLAPAANLDAVREALGR
jgi:uroporphyrinogen decarboxylase